MDLKELLVTRRSCRQFDQSRPIPDDIIADIMESQRYASCSRNNQTLRYVAVTRYETVEAIFRETNWGGRLKDGSGRPAPGRHPVLFVAVIEEISQHTSRSDMNFGLAVSNMTLTAWSKGVASCIIGNVRRAEVMRILSLPDDVYILALLAFGYPMQTSRIEDARLDSSLDYRLDSSGDLVVPKLASAETVRYVR